MTRPRIEPPPHCDCLACAQPPEDCRICYPRCDACGARVAGLVREEVEGVTCERCPTCRQEGAVP